MKQVILLLFLILACEAPAQVLSFDPERLVSIQLSNGNTLYGRIVDADTRQLHLVGSKVNQLIPFSLLNDSTRKELNLLPPSPSENAPISDFYGMNSTRALLKTSQTELSSFNQSRDFYRTVPSGVIYPAYPFSAYPAIPRTRCYSGGLFIHF